MDGRLGACSDRLRGWVDRIDVGLEEFVLFGTVALEAIGDWEEDFLERKGAGIDDCARRTNLPEEVGGGRDQDDLVLLFLVERREDILEKFVGDGDATEGCTDDNDVVDAGGRHIDGVGR